MAYAFACNRAALRCLLTGRIRVRTFVRALRERPIAVPGRGGNHILCPDFAEALWGANDGRRAS
ncbi:hypothetical protein [Sphingomonas oryzagri]